MPPVVTSEGRRANALQRLLHFHMHQGHSDILTRIIMDQCMQC